LPSVFTRVGRELARELNIVQAEAVVSTARVQAEAAVSATQDQAEAALAAARIEAASVVAQVAHFHVGMVADVERRFSVRCSQYEASRHTAITDAFAALAISEIESLRLRRGR
jgi:multidrug efflux pump subunit AcrA (membrane-fusion protein)